MLHPSILGIIGPSGCGKSTIIRELTNQHPEIVIAKTFTDRPIRNDEVDADHIFVASARFDELDAKSSFLEVVRPFSLTYRYGLEPVVPGVPLTIIMLREPFVPLLKKHYPQAKVYQIDATKAFAKRALLKRGDTEPGTRLTGFISERTNGRKIADRVFTNHDNTDIHNMAKKVYEVMQADYKHLEFVKSHQRDHNIR